MQKLLSTTFALSSRSLATSTSLWKGYDPVQESLMDNENLILVDAEDKVTGKASKRYCHLVQADGSLPLHRAFSIYLFNTKGEFLLQQRSDTKITFPAAYTNTCCSHPLYIADEMDMSDNGIGVKRAALRRIETELGVGSDQLKAEDVHLMTRMLYEAKSDSIWGEHELAYLFVVKKDIEIKANPNEVKDVKYVSQNEFRDFEKDCDNRDVKFTPWFSLVKRELLFNWWNNIDRIMSTPYDGKIRHMYEK